MLALVRHIKTGLTTLEKLRIEPAFVFLASSCESIGSTSGHTWSMDGARTAVQSSKQFKEPCSLSSLSLVIPLEVIVGVLWRTRCVSQLETTEVWLWLRQIRVHSCWIVSFPLLDGCWRRHWALQGWYVYSADDSVHGRSTDWAFMWQLTMSMFQGTDSCQSRAVLTCCWPRAISTHSSTASSCWMRLGCLVPHQWSSWGTTLRRFGAHTQLCRTCDYTW